MVHVMSQMQYRENSAWHIVVGYVVSRYGNCRRFVGRLVFSASLDKLVCFRHQLMFGNHTIFFNTLDLPIFCDFLKVNGIFEWENIFMTQGVWL